MIPEQAGLIGLYQFVRNLRLLDTCWGTIAIQDLLTDARQKIKRDPRLREKTIRHHGAIIRCLRQRDAKGARRAMERHMAYALEALKSVLDDDVVHHRPAPRKGRPSQEKECTNERHDTPADEGPGSALGRRLRDQRGAGPGPC
jgi:hypothetical protein